MRIVSGKHRGRILTSPKDDLVRPTSDKVRLALFNALQHRGVVLDAVVLDAFCGTAALGLEALSQGASKAIFIDREKSSLDLAKINAATLKETDNSFFILKDSTKLTPRPDHIPPATLCFLDPPYRKMILPEALQSLQDKGWLAAGCWIVAEMEREYVWLDFIAESDKEYGDTKIVMGRI